MTLWKVHCEEDEYPGIWRHWYRHQCVAVGWPPGSGFTFEDGPTADVGWRIARNALKKLSVDDAIVVTFKGNRVGRIGRITGLKLKDADWNPLVPRRHGLPEGELGRRIEVRWDLTCGPDDRDALVHLPPALRLSGASLRLTIARLDSLSEQMLRSAINDPANWVRLGGGFRYERSLSDYIAAFPHRLEDGLVTHPDSKVREKVFKDKTRLDVLLMDRDGNPIVVECKQQAPSVEDVKQLQHYLDLLKKETGSTGIRGLLVHGGSRRVSGSVSVVAARDKRITLVFHQLDVHFDRTVAS